MAQQRCIVKNQGAPFGVDRELAEVELCIHDEKTGEYTPTGEIVKVPSLLYFKPGAGVVNDFTPAPETQLPAGRWLCAVE